jgi:hypothetical protein
VNTFENWCDSQNLPATADRRAVWNAALEEAAKAAGGKGNRAALPCCVDTAIGIERAIRAMQTTAGAAGGEGK